MRKYVPEMTVPPSAGGGVFARTYVAATTKPPLTRALHVVRASLFESNGASDAWRSAPLSSRGCVSVDASVAESTAAPSGIPSSVDEEEQLMVAARATVTSANVLERKKLALMPSNVVAVADRVEPAPAIGLRAGW